MDCTIVGAGRMGTALAHWLVQSAAPARRIVSRRAARARALASATGAAEGLGLQAWFRQVEQSPPGLLLLAVPDDALAPLARELAAARPDWSGWRVLHTSGARPAAVLAPLHRRGAAVSSLHPMMTFNGATVPAPQGVVFSFAGDAAACRTARALVRRWGGLPLPLAAAAKSRYHLAATLVGPGAVVAMAAAEQVLRQAGLRGAPLRRARQGLLALQAATHANLHRSAASAWTGPLARGDWDTVARQRRLLPSPAQRKLYDGMVAAAAELLPCATQKKKHR